MATTSMNDQDTSAIREVVGFISSPDVRSIVESLYMPAPIRHRISSNRPGGKPWLHAPGRPRRSIVENDDSTGSPMNEADSARVEIISGLLKDWLARLSWWRISLEETEEGRIICVLWGLNVGRKAKVGFLPRNSDTSEKLSRQPSKGLLESFSIACCSLGS